MTTEHHRPIPQPPDKETTAVVVDALFMLWGKLPAQQQATTALVMIDRIFQSGEQPWLREELATRWLVPMDELATAFPLVDIRHADLEQLSFSPDEVVQLEEDDLLEIAQTLRDHYVHDWFREEAQSLVRERLNERKVV